MPSMPGPVALRSTPTLPNARPASALGSGSGVRSAANRIVPGPARPTAANNIVRGPAARALDAAPAGLPAAATVVFALLGALKSGPALLGVRLVAEELLSSRPANRGEIDWLVQRRGEQFIGNLRLGQGVTQALSRLSTGLFVNDISVATLRTERTALAKAIGRRDSTAAPRHFGTIAKAMAFDARAKDAGVAAVRREIGRLNATGSRPSAPVRSRASGKALGASNPSHKPLEAGRPAARAQRGIATTASPHRLPALGGSSVTAAPRPALLERASRITHTRDTGTRTEVETRFREQRAQALQDALRIVNKRIKTRVPGGPSVAQLARAVYRERPELQAAGLSEDAFVSQVKAPGKLAGGDGGGRVRASAGGGAGVGASHYTHLLTVHDFRERT